MMENSKKLGHWLTSPPLQVVLTTMLRPHCENFKSLWWMFVSALLNCGNGDNFTQHVQEKPPCQPGFYCPVGSFTPIPCPKGTYGPTTDGISMDSCLKCPPHHYCHRPGLSSSLPCGPVAQQPLPGQDTCLCPGAGQTFQQVSDGQCLCTLGYQPAKDKDACVHKLYNVCRDGKTRTQYGDCLDQYQWSLYCKQQVCQSAEDFEGYSGELGLCVCREPPGRAACGGLCRNRPASELNLRFLPRGEKKLIWSRDGQVSGISSSVLDTVFKQWDFQRNLLFSSSINSSHPVYIVQTTELGFLGLLGDIPKQLEELFLAPKQQDTRSSDGDHSTFPQEVSTIASISPGGSDILSSSRITEESEETSAAGILNPTMCLRLGNIVLFTADTHHYPQYDVDNLYNTNADFDWGAFRKLKDEMTFTWTPAKFFPVIFDQPGVYVFALSSQQHKHLYVRVMPTGGQCYEPGPFFPPTPQHLTRIGISRRRNLLLRPEWPVMWGLLFCAAVILCLCVTLLILFHEYGWPEKKPIKARYHLLQLTYRMDDYASKGSRVISQMKTHRNQQAIMTRSTIQPDTTEDFWDYEHQVDLEAFSSSIFYSLLLKQSLSVTTRLGELTTEVKQLYRGLLEKLQLLHPCLITEPKVEDGCEKIRREVEREVERRKSLAAQLKSLLHTQLQVLRQEQQTQLSVHTVFMAKFRECTRLMGKVYSNDEMPHEQQHRNMIHRFKLLVDEMGQLVAAECQRQGAWGLLGEGTGAKLLCPDTGTVLTKDCIFGPDGSLYVCQAVHYDSVTHLISPKGHSHMLLNSGHTTAVPPDFFLHPQTGRVMPIAGNIAYDPDSSTLVCTTDLCEGNTNQKWDNPLIPFIPYPTSGNCDQSLPSIRLRSLRPGQKLQLNAPMADPETGVPVPILAVTIHPQNGLVYPLGGVHICPITCILQPIQIGYPMLDPRTGQVVLTVGVSLDPMTGAVVPVGGVLLGEFFIEPLSGRMVKVGGASLQAGQLVPRTGGHQAFLDSKVLAVMLKVVELLRRLTGGWESDLNPETRERLEPSNCVQDHLSVTAKELEQQWGNSQLSHLQLQTRLEIVLGWAEGVQQDGGSLGQMPVSGSETGVPALLGLEYPDPMGSGINVPVLGYETDIVSGINMPLAGTMEDPNGKGLVAIRYGSQTVDPVTGLLAPVVGARLDVFKNSIVPVTASYWFAMGDQTHSAQIEALQRELSVRNIYWQKQTQWEENTTSDLDKALFQCLHGVTDTTSYQVHWPGRQLKRAAAQMQDAAQAEAQRRAVHCSNLTTMLPPNVVHILMQGDESEWTQQSVWHAELMSGLDRLDIYMEQLQEDREKWTSQRGDWATSHHIREMRWRELQEECFSRQTELETALETIHFVRHLSKLRADMAQAILSQDVWCKEYGLAGCSRSKPTVRASSLFQQKALTLLERLNQHLENKQASSLCPDSCLQHLSVLSQDPNRMETSTGVWTASVPVLKEKQPQGVCAPPTHILVPVIPEDKWPALLAISPLFKLLKDVELQLKYYGSRAGFTVKDLADNNTFMDALECQWECEGELIPWDTSTLNPEELLVYQHGLSLIDTLHALKLTPAISIQIAVSLPKNNYSDNAFRNSFFYEEADETLFVRRQRLQSVGGFSLLLLHCLSHVQVKDMSADSNPIFQRLFFKMLEKCLEQLFHAGPDSPPPSRAANLGASVHNKEIPLADLKGNISAPYTPITPQKHKN